jgi:hypothetical protein
MEQILEVTAWLEAQTGKTVSIQKGEFAIGKAEIIDRDEVEIRLDKVLVKSIEQPDPDDYLANKEVILHGQGNIQSDMGKVGLPQDVYEISLSGKVTAHKVDNGYRIQTERAVYSIHTQ